MSERMEDALISLEVLGEEGRDALRIAGLVWEESWRRAEEQAEKAEWLLEKLRPWAAGWSLGTDLDSSLAHWSSHYYREPRSPLPWHEQRIEQRERELHELRKRLEEAREANHRMARIADRDRLRAETAERECDELRAEDRSLRYRKGRP